MRSESELAVAQALRWRVEESVHKSEAVQYRDLFARSLAELDVKEICARYTYLQPAQMVEFVGDVCARFGLVPSGTGVELGAGTGLLSAAFLKSFQGITRVYAVEVVPGMVELAMPKVAASFGSGVSSRLTPVVGSFDQLELPDASVDFAIEIDSLHHSADLSITLRELARVLKPGGRLIAIDRAHSDSVSDQAIEDMLNIVYDAEFLANNFYPPGVRMTRRMNGEHEYRLREWHQLFADAGLSVAKVVSLVPRFSARRLAKNLSLVVLPRGVVRRFTSSTKSRGKALKEVLRELGHARIQLQTPTGDSIVTLRAGTAFEVIRQT